LLAKKRKTSFRKCVVGFFLFPVFPSASNVQTWILFSPVCPCRIQRAEFGRKTAREQPAAEIRNPIALSRAIKEKSRFVELRRRYFFLAGRSRTCAIGAVVGPFPRDYLAFSSRGDATSEMKTLAIARRELSDIGIC